MLCLIELSKPRANRRWQVAYGPQGLRPESDPDLQPTRGSQSILAVENFDSLKELYKKDVFTAFMWAAAQRMTDRLTGVTHRGLMKTSILRIG